VKVFQLSVPQESGSATAKIISEKKTDITITSSCLSPCGWVLYLGSEDGKTAGFRFSDMKIDPLKSTHKHKGSINGMIMNKKGNKLFTAGDDGNLGVSHLTKEKCLDCPNVFEGGFMAMALLLGDTELCVGSYAGEMKIIHLESRIYRDLGKPHERIESIIASNDGWFFYTADSQSGHVKRWSAQPEEPATLVDEHKFGERICRMIEMEM